MCKKKMKVDKSRKVVDKAVDIAKKSKKLSTDPFLFNELIRNINFLEGNGVSRTEIPLSVPK
ncbi:MAG: hypothetical protein K0R67_2901 [Paenibacillus sp.]|nr:hypothetical protein [Paenibacillus sp.]